MLQYRPLENWGSHLWAFMHTVCVVDFDDSAQHVQRVLAVLRALKDAIPCRKCASEYELWLANLERTQVSRGMELFWWSVDFHNSVNTKLGKPILSREDALGRWTIQIGQ